MFVRFTHWRVALSTLLFACITSPLFAQERSITGLVIVRDSGQPIAGATVEVPALSLSAVTDEQGRYSIGLDATRPLGDRLTITATFSGMSPVTHTLAVGPGPLAQDFALSAGFQEVVVVGSRASGGAADKAVPVDILSADDIARTGATETMQALEMLAPSFNFPRPTLSDGTDSVRPATLRGLGPDQVLVLVNGKRRHQTAIVHINNTVGRGSTGVDLNAIPVSAIERIEILRDGAAAQYGSDAIAGVINIVLKSRASRPTLEARLGGNFGTFQDVFGTATEFSDGGTFDLQGSQGFAVGRGLLTIAGEYRDRKGTNRAGPDTGDAFGPQPNIHWGDSQETNGLLFANFEHPLPVGEHTTVYAFGGWSRREGSHGGAYRRRIDAGNIPEIYPDGFLPLIEPTNVDASAAGGVRGTWRRTWFWDVSGVYGRNRLDFDVVNSLNVSLGPALPPNQTEFYSGAIRFDQLTVNADARRQVGIGLRAPANLAFGLEYRRDGYAIVAGEAASYIDGGVPDQFGRPAIPGAQVFPGFRPSNETNVSRNSVAAYGDLEADLTAWLRIGLAGRHERFDDFGDTTDGKVTVRLAPVRRVVVRGAASTGFRAPSLGQINFSAVSTNFVQAGGAFVPVEAGTYPVSSPQALALGSTPLRPEESVNVSAGLVVTPVDALEVAVDVYRIDIDDRIVLSDTFTGPQIADLLRPFGANGARYFTNAIDTKTTGVDVVATYTVPTDRAGTFRVRAAYNHTETDITRIAATPPQLTGLDNTLFSRTAPNDVEFRRYTCVQPRNNARLSTDWRLRRLSALVRATGVGDYCSLEALDQTYEGQWLTDIEVTYDVGRSRIGFGIQNIGNVLPTRNIVDVSNRGGRTFPRNAPFGFNGRYVYVRLGFTF
jgi:iron complex outermembrane recepter protein